MTEQVWLLISRDEQSREFVFVDGKGLRLWLNPDDAMCALVFNTEQEAKEFAEGLREFMPGLHRSLKAERATRNTAFVAVGRRSPLSRFDNGVVRVLRDTREKFEGLLPCEMPACAVRVTLWEAERDRECLLAQMRATLPLAQATIHKVPRYALVREKPTTP